MDTYVGKRHEVSAYIGHPMPSMKSRFLFLHSRNKSEDLAAVVPRSKKKNVKKGRIQKMPLYVIKFT